MGRLKNLAKNSPAGARMSVAKNYGEVATLGLSFIFSLLIGCGIGWWLDQRFGWKPYGFLGGLALGFAAAIRTAWVVLKPVISRKPSAGSGQGPSGPDQSQPYDDRP